jgi:hypothetical protein
VDPGQHLRNSRLFSLDAGRADYLCPFFGIVDDELAEIGGRACKRLRAPQGRDLAQVGITMFAFGMGAALPLLALGLFSREAVMRWRNQLLSTGHGVKVALGLLFVAIGALVLSGFDKTIETALVDASPQWLIDLSTRF